MKHPSSTRQSSTSLGRRISEFIGRLRQYGSMAAILPLLQRIPGGGLTVPVRVRYGEKACWLRLRPGTTDSAVCYEMFLADELEITALRSPAVNH